MRTKWSELKDRTTQTQRLSPDPVPDARDRGLRVTLDADTVTWIKNIERRHVPRSGCSCVGCTVAAAIRVAEATWTERDEDLCTCSTDPFGECYLHGNAENLRTDPELRTRTTVASTPSVASSPPRIHYHHDGSVCAVTYCPECDR
jgi:hypothetical protein